MPKPTTRFPPICILLAIGVCFNLHGFAQSSIDSFLNKIDPQRWANTVEKKVQRLEDKLVRQSLKTLERFQKQEERIYNRLLNTKDSLLAKENLSALKDRYGEMREKLSQESRESRESQESRERQERQEVGKISQYIPQLDSLGTAFKFLDQNGMTGKFKDVLSRTNSLHNKFQSAEEIKAFIKQRKEQLKAKLEQLGMLKELKQFNKEVYYYAARIKEYKEILKDPRKIERKAMELLSNTKLFRDFMKKNSLLASLFAIPGDGPLQTSPLGGGLAGLQTHVQVNNLIQQQITARGPGAQQQFQQNLQAAQSQLDQLKTKFLKNGSGSSDDIMPDGFKPNAEKTKSFWKRLELGTNLQTQSARNYFPVTSDFGLSLGYKLNKNSIFGIGGSYKLGWGSSWNSIRISHEGVGFRSFIDWKIPSPKGGGREGAGSFWLTGGYEMNYRTAFNNITELRNYDSWQRSGLLGLSKSIPAKGKFFKKTKLQLLWDFLSYEQVPRTQTILFRIGYNFK